LRVVIAHPHVTYPGGATAVALETGSRLASRGHEVHLVSLRNLPELIERFRGIEFHDLHGPLSSELRYWLQLPIYQARFNAIVDALSPDAVLAHAFPANYWAFVNRLRNKAVPCVWYCHEPSAFVHDWRVIRGVPWPMQAAVLAANPFLQLADRVLARSADQIVTNSSYTAERIRRIYGRRASVAEPGVDATRFGARPRKERLVLCVGRLTRFKRFDIVLRAAAELQRQGVEVRWVIVGSGEEQQALASMARSLSVGQAVTFTGLADEATLTGFYRRAAIVAVTSINEPFGIVPVEGMAAGAAVVCSDTGGPARAVDDGVTGLHFRSGDHLDLARKVAYLLENRALATEMGARGREIARTRYTWDRTTDGIERAFHAASRTTPAPPGGSP
jgi:glycosyltransferase involved in cell wall biosynthesis